MKSLTLDRIARMCRGRIVSGRGDETFDAVCIDSRLAKQGSVFFALKGEVTDGHLYIGKAVETGAGCVITDHETDCFGACQIVTEDTFKALQDMAAAYRDMFDIPFVGVTGSSGKTTNKDLIASVLSQKYDVLKTFGNLNSTTGVPLTLFDLEDHHQIAVIEMSMSAPGEILGNAAIVRPDTAVITNVGTAHIEFLGSRENIFRAKSEIMAYMHEGNRLIVNGEDDMLSTISDTPYDVVMVGIDHGDLRAYDIFQGHDSVSFSCRYAGCDERFTFGYVGTHNIINCLNAIAVAEIYGLSPEQVQAGFNCFEPSSNRMQIVQAGGMTLINDAYNANYEAFSAAMDFLCRRAEGRKVVVASDMYELGEFSPQLHRKTGERAAELGVDLLIACGEYIDSYRDGYLSSGGAECVVFPDRDSMAAELKKLLKAGDTVLFKASRGVKLEEVFNSLKENL